MADACFGSKGLLAAPTDTMHFAKEGRRRHRNASRRDCEPPIPRAQRRDLSAVADGTGPPGPARGFWRQDAFLPRSRPIQKAGTRRGGRLLQVWNLRAREENQDRSGCSRYSGNVAALLEVKDHSMDGRTSDPKEVGDLVLGRRSSMNLGIEVNVSEVLPLNAGGARSQCKCAPESAREFEGFLPVSINRVARAHTRLARSRASEAIAGSEKSSAGARSPDGLP